MEKIVHLQHLRNEKLIQLLNAEVHQAQFLDEITSYSYSISLRSYLQTLSDRSATHAKCLDLILSELGETEYYQINPAVKAITREAKKVFYKCLEPELADAGLISSIQSLKHYLISGYRTSSAFSKVLGDQEIYELLHTMWQEEIQQENMLAGFAEANMYENAKGAIRQQAEESSI